MEKRSSGSSSWADQNPLGVTCSCSSGRGVLLSYSSTTLRKWLLVAVGVLFLGFEAELTPQVNTQILTELKHAALS